MAFMPEIIGETREQALERSDEQEEQESVGEPAFPPRQGRHLKLRALTETLYGAPPFMIRLSDFSGEGERAPPVER